MIRANELSGMSDSDLIAIYKSFNNWQWPEVLGEQPKGWDEMPRYLKPQMSECVTREDFIRPYMRFIRQRVSHDQIYNDSGLQTDNNSQGLGCDRNSDVGNDFKRSRASLVQKGR